VKLKKIIALFHCNVTPFKITNCHNFFICWVLNLMYQKAEPWLKLTAVSGQLSNTQFNYIVDANCNNVRFSLKNKLLSVTFISHSLYRGLVNNEGVSRTNPGSLYITTLHVPHTFGRVCPLLTDPLNSHVDLIS